MTAATYTVSGMTCGGCIHSARAAFGEPREAVADAGHEVTT